VKKKEKCENVNILRYKYYCTELVHKVNGISEHLKSELHKINAL